MGKHDRVENGLDLDEGAPASNSKIPLPLKVFGILCICLLYTSDAADE